MIVGYGAGGWAVGRIASDAQTAQDARTYLFWYLPALATMFPGAALGSALRASGVVGMPMITQSVTVVINASYFAPRTEHSPLLGPQSSALHFAHLALSFFDLWDYNACHDVVTGISI